MKVRRKDRRNRYGIPKRGTPNHRVIVLETVDGWEHTYHFTKGYAWRRA